MRLSEIELNPSRQLVLWLINKHDEVTSESHDMSEMFNQFFASVYTPEDSENIPGAEPLFQADDD